MIQSIDLINLLYLLTIIAIFLTDQHFISITICFLNRIELFDCPSLSYSGSFIIKFRKYVIGTLLTFVLCNQSTDFSLFNALILCYAASCSTLHGDFAISQV